MNGSGSKVGGIRRRPRPRAQLAQHGAPAGVLELEPERLALDDGPRIAGVEHDVVVRGGGDGGGEEDGGDEQAAAHPLSLWFRP